MIIWRGGEQYVVYRGRREMRPEFWWGILQERDHLEDLDPAGNVILKWINGRCVYSSGSEEGQMAVWYEEGECFHKCGDVLEYLRSC